MMSSGGKGNMQASTTAAETMIKTFAEISRGKPIKKCFELDLHKKYRILSVSKVLTPHISIFIECEDFKYFLPNHFKNSELVDIDEKENFAFSIEKLNKLSNGYYTPIIQFYIDNKIVE